jgi:hypothetical protein
MDQNLFLIVTVMGSASFGVIAGKLIDIFFLSRVNEKIEKTKWLRQEKLEAFTELSKEINSLGFENNSFADEWKLNSLATKALLLLNNEKVEIRIRNFIKELIQFTTNEYPNILNQVDSKQIKLPSGDIAGEKEFKIGLLLTELQKEAVFISNELKIDLIKT